MAKEEDEELMWLEEDELEEKTTGVSSASDAKKDEKVSDGVMDDLIRSLEAELTRSRKELSDVRKELAAKVSISVAVSRILSSGSHGLTIACATVHSLPFFRFADSSAVA